MRALDFEILGEDLKIYIYRYIEYRKNGISIDIYIQRERNSTMRVSEHDIVFDFDLLRTAIFISLAVSMHGVGGMVGMVGMMGMHACISIRLSFLILPISCPSAVDSVHLSVCLSVCLSVQLSSFLLYIYTSSVVCLPLPLNAILRVRTRSCVS